MKEVELEHKWAYRSKCKDCDFDELRIGDDELPFDTRFHILVEEHTVHVIRCNLATEQIEMSMNRPPAKLKWYQTDSWRGITFALSVGCIVLNIRDLNMWSWIGIPAALYWVGWSLRLGRKLKEFYHARLSR